MHVAGQKSKKCPQVEGRLLCLSARHAKLRRDGYRKDRPMMVRPPPGLSREVQQDRLGARGGIRETYSTRSPIGYEPHADSGFRLLRGPKEPPVADAGVGGDDRRPSRIRFDVPPELIDDTRNTSMSPE